MAIFINDSGDPECSCGSHRIVLCRLELVEYEITGEEDGVIVTDSNNSNNVGSVGYGENDYIFCKDCCRQQDVISKGGAGTRLNYPE